MKKKFLTFILILSLFIAPLNCQKREDAIAKENPKLAIVIDDFGEDRVGVEEMLSLPCKLTIAVMPGLEYSKEDSEHAHELGHEVILHMPMENQSYTPASFYGPVMIKNSFSQQEATETLNEALSGIEHAKGINIHMGTGVSKNRELISAIMKEAKKKDLYFLDSKTVEGSVCDEVSKDVGVNYYSRDVFLEPPGRPSYETAVKELFRAVELAKEKGKAIAIGHIGPVGGTQTAEAIRDNLAKIKDLGVDIVPLSQL